MDENIRIIRLNRNLKHLNNVYEKGLLEEDIYNILNDMIKSCISNLDKFLSGFRLNSYNNKSKKNKNNINNNFKNNIKNHNLNKNKINDNKCIIAFSGGIDSVSSSIISKYIFKEVIGLTVYSPEIMDSGNLKNIENLSKRLGIDWKYITISMEDIEKDTINGIYHPCGRCHKVIEDTVLNYGKKNNIKYIIFGDLLAIGPMSIMDYNNEIIRINLPSLLSLTKDDNKKILLQNGIKISQNYSCPLLKKSYRFQRNKKFTIQRILREVRAQVLSEKDGFKNIMEVLNG